MTQKALCGKVDFFFFTWGGGHKYDKDSKGSFFQISRVRLKAYDVSLLLSNHLMFLRPLETFLRAFEVVRGENLGSQK